MPLLGLLLVLTAVLPPHAPPELSVLSDCGSYRSYLRSVETIRGAAGQRSADLMLNIWFLDPEDGKPMPRPEDRFLEADCRVLSLQGASLEELDDQCRSLGANFGPTVRVWGLPVPPDCSELRGLVLEVPVVTVKKWRRIRHRRIPPGDGPALFCGPLDLVLRGEERSVILKAELSELHREKRDRPWWAPVGFLGADYALRQVVIQDADGARLRRAGGGDDGIRRRARFVRSKEEMISAADWLPLSYPLRLELSLPRRVETETARFRLPPIPLSLSEEPVP